MKVSIVKADVSNSGEIHAMQIISFEDLLKKYKDYETNPGAESVDDIVKRMNDKYTDYYFIVQEEKNGSG